jgi:Mg/Co/Ni transporter MgtE
MKISQTAIVGACGAVANPLAAFIAHTVFEDFSGLVQWLAVVITGLSIGMLEGIFIARPLHRAIGIGTFIGLLIIWSPVVMVTYGFALLALPLLAAFAVLVWLGTKLGNTLRARAPVV